MDIIDILNNDAFGVANLIAAINETDEGYQPPLPIVDNLFGEEGVDTPVIGLELQGDSLSLVRSAPRGSRGQVVRGTKRKMTHIEAVHLPETAAILADEVSRVRAFGSSSELETFQTKVAGRLRKMRTQLDLTQSYQRLGALKGLVLDADGKTPLYDLYDLFGVKKQTATIGLADSATKVNQAIVAAKRLSEKALGGSIMVDGWLCLAGQGFMDSMTGHDDVRAAYARWNDGAFARSDNRLDFQFAGVDFVEFSASVGGVDFLGADEAILIPRALAGGMFTTYYAPADYMETVNTTGLPYYAKMEPMPMDKGLAMEAQSNPLHINQKPRAIIHLKP